MPGPDGTAGPRHGRVTAFDRTRGLGTVEAVDGTTYGFHATSIADGSRTVEVGAVVTFVVVPGQRGRYEARSLLPVPVPPSDAAGSSAASHAL